MHAAIGTAQQVALRAFMPEIADDIAKVPPPPVEALASCFGALIPQGIFTYFGCDRNVRAAMPSQP